MVSLLFNKGDSVQMKMLSTSISMVKENNIINTVIFVNSEKSILAINDFIYKPEYSISNNELLLIENIIKLCKCIYEENKYMTNIKYKSIPDDRYDSMLEKYKTIKGFEPFQSSSPTGMRSIKHDFSELVGTLDKAYEIYDISDKMSVEKYLKKISKEIGKDKFTIIVIPKYDGTSTSVTFKNHNNIMEPIKATSRGDFEENNGVDMSNILYGLGAKFDKSEEINFKNIDTFGIQYEAIITEANKIRLSKITGVKYSTRRAAIAAAVKRSINENTTKEERKKINECITLVPVGISDNLLNITGIRWGTLMGIIGSDFEYSEWDKIHEQYHLTGTVADILVLFQRLAIEFSAKRQELNYSIDGLVISIKNDTVRRDLGRSNNKNKWQIAYKFGAMIQRTNVTGIISSHGKQGYIGHNITFNPIEFDGVKYDKAPVNNITRFNKLDLRIGDEVLVSYNADVMGYIYKDETCRSNKLGEKIKFPTKCDHCKSDLIINKDMLKCANVECISEHIGIISEMVRILDIDFFGEETLISLAEEGVSSTIKFLSIDKELLSRVLKGKVLDKTWDEFKNKIIAEIEYAKVLDMLRIQSLRTKTAKKILNHVDIDILLPLMRDKKVFELKTMLKSVPGIDMNSEVFASGLIDKYDELVKLLKILNVKRMNTNYDKSILISGFRNNTRLIQICNKLNYEIVDSGKYDILVVSPDRMYGNKALKARKDNKPIYTLVEFINKFSK